MWLCTDRSYNNTKRSFEYKWVSEVAITASRNVRKTHVAPEPAISKQAVSQIDPARDIE